MVDEGKYLVNANPKMNTYLITGANRGIGLEYCRQLKERGDNVIAVCRTASEELENLNVSIETGVDITSDTDVLRLIKSSNSHFEEEGN